MSRFDWKGTLATVAPAIATALGGPLAGVAVKVAADALGIDADESLISEAIASGNPEILLKLKEAELNFKMELKRLDVTLEEIASKDRQSARDLAKIVGILPQISLATIFFVSFAAVLYGIFSGEVVLTTDQKDIGMYLLGILSAGIVQIMNYFFGSSAGSRQKTDLLGKKE